jgi:predicted nucleic acid-binding protein
VFAIFRCAVTDGRCRSRLAAKTLGVEARGTLGLLVRAIRRHQLSKAEAIELLRQIPERSTLHIRPGLLKEIIRQIADTPEPQ